MSKTQPTGYWAFFCNPKMWSIEEFIESGVKDDDFSITEWQKDWFRAGQIGVIRVGHDGRTKVELGGRRKLERGIYAIVLITGEASSMKANKKHWIDKSALEKQRYRVPIRYLKTMLDNPILIDDLSEVDGFNDIGILDGRQASSWPLEPAAFHHLKGSEEEMNYLISLQEDEPVTTYSRIQALEEQYKYAVPEVKERISNYIERGEIANAYKAVTGYKCQVCEAVGLNPVGFKKENGEPYIETHHVIPVSNMEAGLLGVNNLLTLCPNHHRQMHYGKVELISNTEREYKFDIDGEVLSVKKVRVNT